jgi:spermidine synthase
MKFLTSWRVRKPATEQTPYISERDGVRTLHIGSDTVQSAMRLAKPNDLELAYTRSMMGFLLFRPPPADVLMIGLGGGSLAKFMYHQLPQARVRAVELNPAVVAIARQCFHLPSDDARFAVVVGDGSEYVLREEVEADVILLDGYDADAHAKELESRKFYAACRERLRPGGMLVVNLWRDDMLFNHLLRRIRATFPGGTLCLPASRPGNVIVFGFAADPGPLEWTAIDGKARELERALGLEFTRFADALRKMNRHDERLLYATGPGAGSGTRFS